MIMETLIQFVGYLVLSTSVLAVFYVFYKVLATGFKAFMKHDD